MPPVAVASADMIIDVPSLLVGAVLTGVVSYVVSALILRRQERRESVRDLVIAIAEAASWASDRMQFHFTPTAERGEEPEWGVIERNIRVRIFRGCRRLPPALDDKTFQGRATRLASYIANVFTLLGRVSKDKDDAVLFINQESRTLQKYLESWLDGKWKPRLGPEPDWADPAK